MNISRIYRILRLITMLQGGRSYSVSDLARDLEVSRRTVFRDLNMLELAHIPYFYDQQSGGYSISDHFFLPPVNLTLPEAMSILILASGLGKSADFPLAGQSARAAVKLESVLPPAIRQQIGSVLDRVDMSLGPVARHEKLDDIFYTIAGAVGKRRICRIVYISFHEHQQVTTFIHPLRMIFVGKAWYLLAYSARHRQVRTFKLGRIRKITVTNRTFRWPEDVDPSKHFGSAWSMIPEGKIYNIRLRFEAKVAGNVAEVMWHPSQQVRWLDDGSMEYEVKVDGLGEITWWILGYGDQVEVLAPAVLRRRIRQVASTVLERYDRQKVC